MIDPITDWNAELGLPGGEAALSVSLESESVVRQQFRVSLRDTDSPRLVKYLRTYVHNRVWAIGAQRVVLDCEQALFDEIEPAFLPGGELSHQAAMMSDIYGGRFEIFRGSVRDECGSRSGAAQQPGRPKVGKHIGVDLGGSDAKVVALVDGELLHHEKQDWKPKSLREGKQAVSVVRGLVERALARAGIDAPDGIGISSAGIVVDDQIMASGIFGGMPAGEFREWVMPMGRRVSEAFGGVPTCVAHDGDMTPLWAYVDMGIERVLGLSLGTGLGAGFVGEGGRLPGLLCEVGKAILDMSPDAPEHIYNRTRGPALHYCSQNAVFRLAEEAGIALDGFDMLAEKLRHVQRLADERDDRAETIFQTVGKYLATAVAEFHDYFGMAHVLLVGRVTAGATGELLAESSKAALEAGFPEVARTVQIHMPTPPVGTDPGIVRELGQAMAAAYWSSMRVDGARG